MKTKSPTLIAAVLAAAFMFTLVVPSAEAAPPYKVPGIGYFDGNLNKEGPQSRTCCKKARACSDCKKSVKCSKCCRSVKVVSASPDSKKVKQTPYWKKKLR